MRFLSSIKISPLSGLRREPNIFISVLFPDPEGPIIQTILPDLILRLISTITLLTEFPEHLLKFMIKRHRYISAKKYRQGTKAWLFTIDNDVLYFNQKDAFINLNANEKSQSD